MKKTKSKEEALKIKNESVKLIEEMLKDFANLQLS